MTRLLQMGAALCLLLALMSGASAAERILNYDSDITVNTDGTLDVTETISVRAEGQNIRRGIYRDFPTDYRDRFGNKVRVGFDLLEVRRNGIPEPHHVARLSNGLRIYAGSSDVFIPSGAHEYTFRYRVTRSLGFFDTHDELYWNVTGNGWAFPIDHASARIRLPATVPVDAITIEGYVGRMGATGRSYNADIDYAGVAHIETTQMLPRQHGLTVVVGWPKGYVEQPSFADNVVFLLKQNRGLLIVLLAVLAAITFLLKAWHHVGRDPPPGVIFPHYEPPHGYSPASIRYVAKMGYDKTTFTAAVLSLAVQGFLVIQKSAGLYTLQRTDKPARPGMAAGEAALLTSLFRYGKSMLLDDENHAEIRNAMSAHKRTLRGYHYKRYFVTNSVFLLPAILALLVALLALVMLDELTITSGIVFGLGAITVALFAWLLKAPTLLGRKLLDRVEGFKMYLDVAEKDAIDLRNPPEKTPALFEKYLPYALALGVAQPWAEQFAGVFRRLAAEQGQTYHPGWYSGRGWDYADPAGFADVVGDSLNSAIASASTPPGSSSGGGGGGFSGGGGGGGGGGGW